MAETYEVDRALMDETIECSRKVINMAQEVLGEVKERHVDEGKREEIREVAERFSDANLVASLLYLHKIVEQGSRGLTQEIAEIEATLLTSALDRFAPGALVEGLALILGGEEPPTTGKDPEDGKRSSKT